MNKKRNQIILASEVIPEELIIMPINDRPVFPGMVVPLVISRAFKKETIDFIQKKKEGYLGVVLIREELPGNDTFENVSHPENYLYRVGCVGKVLKISNINNEEMQILINIIRRFTIKKMLSQNPNLVAKVGHFTSTFNKNDPQIKAYTAALITKVKELIKLNSIFSEEMKLFISRYGTQEPGQLADLITSMLSNISYEDMQQVLETFPLNDRLAKVLNYVHKEVEVNQVKEKINKKIEEKISKQQRAFFLQEQLKYIKQELGLEKDEKSNEIEKIKKKLSELDLSKEAEKITNEELEKLEMYDTRSSEYAVSRNYLSWITALPWGIMTTDNLNLSKAKSILNKDHFGLDEVKSRILEFVAVQKLKSTLSGSILCFVGPPGVGKTSLGKSIAKALGRKFYNFSLGGMRDEAEIKGHRRTYIGAMPGKVIQALKSVESSNPVIMLDEIDKVRSSFQGDPSSSLLEVLDPEQNNQFLDHYLDIRFDLSKILFIATANQIETIPVPLLDRMEVIRISGYILEEKREIAKRFVIPKQIEHHGLNPKHIDFSNKSIEYIIRYYARESGVRSLEHQIKKVLRKVAYKFALTKPQKIKIDNNIQKYLGLEKFKDESPYETIEPGIISGLAWTTLGGSTLYIESIVVSKKENAGNLALTGQLGKVMKESANIAYAYCKSIANRYQIDPSFFRDSQIHLHVPEGATPKDGPSAGITMALSLMSLALNKSVTADLAMTGELTVTGRVLAIGGVREKIIASKRVSKKKIILPADNKKDYNELPKHVQKGVKVQFVKHFPQVLEYALKI